MTQNNRVIRKDRFSFRAMGLPADSTGQDGGPFKKVDTGTGAAITRTSEGWKLTVDPSDTGGASYCGIHFDDQLAYDIDSIVSIDFLLRTNVAPVSGTTVGFGLASEVIAHEEDVDAITEHAMFRALGSAALLLESDDGTNDTDDIAAGQNLSTSMQWFSIDLSQAPQSVAPPGQSVGGKGNVHFYCGNSQGALRRVGDGTLFDVSNYTGGLQPYVFLSSTVADNGISDLSVIISEIEICYYAT